jgi:hypothetical protein
MQKKSAPEADSDSRHCIVHVQVEKKAKGEKHSAENPAKKPASKKIEFLSLVS